MEVSKFLYAFAQSISTMNLYKQGHPARERVIDRSYALLLDMLKEDSHPDFSFLGEEVVYGKTSLREMRDWEWSRRLNAMGIQRLEFDPEVSRDEYIEFLEEVYRRAVTPGAP